MGGYGALNLSMLHPDIFCAGYGMSPGLFKDNGFANSHFINKEGNIEKILSLNKKLKDLPKDKAHESFMEFIDTCTDGALFSTMAYGAAHAPNTERAPYFHFPVKLIDNDTIIDQDIWQRWQNGFGGLDWEIPRYKNNLKQLKLYGFSVGYNDSYRWIIDGCNYLADKLIEEKINHDFFLHHGTHGGNNANVFIHNIMPLFSNILEY
jgi:hypothetical protein